MPEHIDPVSLKLKAVIEARTPALLAAAGKLVFAEVNESWTGAVLNFPAASVMPNRTEFDDEGHLVHAMHQLTVRLSLSANTPDELTADAKKYVRLVDQAIRESDAAGDWKNTLANGNVLRVFVQGHDYGALYEKGNRLAKYPELFVWVETEEVP